ncbi:MAG TPA: carboxylesterase family protein, partial [Saprospiraceae bacterium]|nr:carboxylesterase family protein [Saprospiraceae bacterium]
YNASGRFGFPLVIDGYFLKKPLIEVFKAKEQAMVPLLAGWNSAEIPGMAFMQGMPYTKENFISKVKQTYPTNADEVLAMYPHNTVTEVEQSATDLAADRFIVYSTWKWLDLQNQNSDKPVYRYVYSKLRPELVDKNLVAGLAGGTSRTETPTAAPKAIGAPHACEIEYAMGNLDRIKEFNWTADDYLVSKTMLNYFANFIKTGDPNGTGVPTWKKMEKGSANPDYQIIDVETKGATSTIEKRYHFHDTFYNK